MYSPNTAIVTRLTDLLQRRLEKTGGGHITSYLSDDSAALASVFATYSETYDSIQAITPTHVQRTQLAIVADQLENVEKKAGTQWLGTLRNAYADQIIVLVDTNKCDWQHTDFLALGFKRYAKEENWHLYEYALDSYNLKRDWNNTRFWANPQNFNKFRW